MATHFLSHNKLTSMNQGYIHPIGCIEALPGDSFQHKVTALLRTQPLLAPVMSTCEVKIHHWFVPYRLIWTEFEDFITGGPDGLNESAVPVVESGDAGFAKGSLADHLGIPPLVKDLVVSALPFRAYNYIYNEFYRDQDLQEPVVWSKASGEDTTTNKNMLQGCWEKDYFTAARPNSQKGDDVEIPLSGNAPVILRSPSNTNPARAVRADTHAGLATDLQSDAAGVIYNGSGVPVAIDPNDTLVTDLSDVSAVSINDLRLAVKLQTYRENMLRYGSRYIERLQAAFRVRPQDARLQLPEYLGGGKQNVQFSEVLQTAEGDAPVGEMRGHGIAAMRSNRYRRYIPEYGIIMSFMIIRPRTAYQQGVHKMWLRRVKEDFFQPELQHIGMQAIQNQEIYADHPEKEGMFGFSDRYDEYRSMFDQVSGEMRDLLDFWHMGRKFSEAPALNSDFVTCNGTDRIFATDADQFIVRAQHSIQVKRLVDATGRPMVF